MKLATRGKLKLLRFKYRKTDKHERACGCIIGIMAKKAKIKLPPLNLNGQELWSYELDKFAKRLSTKYGLSRLSLDILQNLNDYGSSEEVLKNKLVELGLINPSVEVEIHG